MGDDRPLTLTLRLDPASQDRFNALRRAHFPPERNHLAAHVTLFHALRADLAGRWRDQLTLQDAQGFRAHVTVQNKVAPEAARALLARLRAEFVPSIARAEGLDLWRYAGGPWEAAGGETFGRGIKPPVVTLRRG